MSSGCRLGWNVATWRHFGEHSAAGGVPFALYWRGQGLVRILVFEDLLARWLGETPLNRLLERVVIVVGALRSHSVRQNVWP